MKYAGSQIVLMALAALSSTTCETPFTPPGPVASVEVTPSTWTPTALGDTMRFSAVAKDAKGIRLVTSDSSFIWSTTPSGIVFVKKDGLATDYQPGSTVISATLDSISGTADVSVSQTIESVVFIYFGDPLRALGDSLRLYEEARDRNGFPVAGTTFSFQTLTPSVANVTSTGYVKAVSPGVAKIVATAAGKADTVSVPVIQDVASIQISPDTAVLEDGATRQFVATMRDHNGYPITDRTPQWSSSDTLAVSVNGAGLATATAVRLGPAIVTATSGGAHGDAPVYVFTPFVSVVAGPAHSCAVSTHGRAYCWGGDDYITGQHNLTPVAKLAPSALDASFGSGVEYDCGLAAGGAAYCWGNPPYGPSGAPAGNPVPFASVVVGYGDVFGLTAAGDVYSWGLSAVSPTLVPGRVSFTTISAAAGACGTIASGAAYCWGSNLTGGLGDSSYTGHDTPTPVVGGHTFTIVAVGGGHTCGITTSGPTYCWGRNLYGAFGDSTTTYTTYPVPGARGLTLTRVTAADWHTCGLVASGAAYCWGFGERGSIGNGQFQNVLIPEPVSGGLTFTSISAGGQHTCALTSTGALYCWGRNEDGELGDGTVTNRAVPTRVAGSRP